MKYRYLFIAIALPIVFAAAIVPSASAASISVSARTCAALATVSDKTFNDVSERAAALGENRAARLDKLAAQWADQDSEKILSRDQADQVKTMDFAALERSLADAPASQKKALVAFETALNAAASTRQSAIDDATGAFRISVQAALQTRSSDLRSATDSFMESVRTSMNKAKANCLTGGAVSVDLEGGLKKELQSIGQGFQKDPRLAAAQPVDVEGFAVKYQAAIQAATATFQSQVLAARAAFKTALGQ